MCLLPYITMFINPIFEQKQKPYKPYKSYYLYKSKKYSL